jgi:enamine deaminase RidA (YjgF/YER057c/UK114 family)
MSMSSDGIQRDDPFGGAYGIALGVRAGDFVFTTVAGVTGHQGGEPVFAPTFEAQLDIIGEHLGFRLGHFGAELHHVVDATVWVHPAVEIAPGVLLDLLQQRVFHGVMPTIAFVRAPGLYPDALAAVKAVAFSPPGPDAS